MFSNGAFSVEEFTPEKEKKPAEAKEEPDNVASVEKAKQISDTYNKLGFKLFAELNKQDKNKNIFISPTSIAMSLALLFNGAEGESLKELEKALELSDKKAEDVNAQNVELLTLLNRKKSGLELSVANSLWVGDKYPVKKEFQDVADKFYKSQITNAKLDAPETTVIINKWASDNTKGKIPKMVDSLDANTIAVLLNAVYFKGVWACKFDKKDTSDKIFYLSDRKEKKIPFMEIAHYMWKHLDKDDFHAVRIPYGVGSASMYVFLPKQNITIDNFMESLTNDNWTKWRGEFSNKSITLCIPKFSSEYSLDLIPSMQKMGVARIFSKQLAELGKLNELAFIKEALHKTFIEVNEEGSEAAAATKILAVTKNGHSIPVLFEANRPFVYLIVDEKTGAVLFMGKMLDPAPTVKATPASKPAPPKTPANPKK
jgi:serpin B